MGIFASMENWMDQKVDFKGCQYTEKERGLKGLFWSVVGVTQCGCFPEEIQRQNDGGGIGNGLGEAGFALVQKYCLF
jgi:hypothetical protein